ncbi:putative disease resistance RPP13-like protein 1 [Hevea brasiliensis]|uniref:putative disease resistance RPP13-like protein 1 n=1 Tax=Hevea brasiliensis TaxID=3981 RepID=UPI0025F55C32|nr:putative disease resistance RPP13-like protein 1 [Hevea brasiliensis]
MAELVGGAILSAFLPVLFERLASPEFRKFFDGQILQGELKKLKITLNSVNGLLTDAEEKQITKPDVKIWLDHLREAIYEADDLLDEIEYKALKSKLKATSWMEKATGFISKYKIRQRLEAILNTLQLLLDQKDTLGLAEKLSLPPKTPTTSLRDDDDDSEIDTRVKDKEAIIESLLSDSDSLVVMPIWGMGGIGKTTLAQLVYNDTRIEAQFQHRPWIFVSEVFDVTRVTKDILRVVNPESSNYDRLDLLQRQLLKEFSSLERKLLIVLDDFWSDNTRDWYTFLKPFLEVEARKAMIKIVVTTRHESVASLTLTGPVEVRHLNELTDRECWYLLEKHAFVKDDSNAYPQLKAHGEKIAKNCRGLPLAAKTIGRLLSAERDVQKWKEISSSDIWDLKNEDINSALRLSYHYLSSLSKRCFAYCALFPKGYEFGKEEVVLLWMAEGFFVQAQGNNSKKEMEEIGNGHFNDLVTRSFFQRSKGSKSHFVMHDLFNDLAKFVSGEFCSRLEGNNSSNIVKRTRHVSYADVDLDSLQKFSGACKDNVLRTFISLEPLERRSTFKRRSTLKTDDVMLLKFNCKIQQIYLKKY